jgi:hypothetical protein
MRGATPCSLGSMMDSGAGRSATSRGMQEAERLQGSMAYPQRGLARGVHHRRRSEARPHHLHRPPPRSIRTITATAEPEGRNKTSPRPFDCAQGKLQFRGRLRIRIQSRLQPATLYLSAPVLPASSANKDGASGNRSIRVPSLPL